MVTFLKELKQKEGVTVKKIRCDNAGENKTLQKHLEKEGMGITFEFTPPNSPQFNARVERSFATLYSIVRSLNNAAKLTQVLRDGLWTEAARTAIEIKNSLCTDGKDVPSFTKFYKRDDDKVRSRRKFGEIAIIKDGRQNIKGKLEDRG